VVVRPAIIAKKKKKEFVTVGSKSFSSYSLLEWIKQVKIAWRQVGAIGGMSEYLPTHFLQCSCCHSGGVSSRVYVEETDAFD
jgi:hypothetical protein